MADNVEANSGSGGAIFAADDIGGVHFPRTKLVIGADGSNDGDVSGANPLPVEGPLTDTELRAAAVDVDGSGVTQPVSGPLTDAELRNSAVPVSGPLTDAELRDSAVPVSLASVPSHAVTNAGTFAVQETGAGYDFFKSIDLDETEEEVKATAGVVHGWYMYNAGEAVVFVKFYNATAANVTVGTTVPDLTLPIPPGAAANLMDAKGIVFDTAITVAATTLVADNDDTAPGANEVVVNIFFK